MSAPLTGTTLGLSSHCLQRMLERNISVAEVRQAITRCDRAFLDRRFEERRVVYAKGDVRVVVALDRAAVVTVLYQYPSGQDRPMDCRPSGIVLTAGARQEIEALLDGLGADLASAA